MRFCRTEQESVPRGVNKNNNSFQNVSEGKKHRRRGKNGGGIAEKEIN